MTIWSREKPTESGWYWCKFEKNGKALIIYYDSCFFSREKYWWAKATPPPFDGEGGE